MAMEEVQIGLLSPKITQTWRRSYSIFALLLLLFFAMACFMVLFMGIMSGKRRPSIGWEHNHGRGELNVLVVGDWGRRGDYNQSLVAKQMGEVSEKLNVDFVISTGDNFYPNGLTGVHDLAFDFSFINIYDATSLLHKTWYSVLGNHDYRGDVLAQLDPHLRSKDPRWNCKRSFALSHIDTSIQGSRSLVDFFFIDTNPFVDKYWDPNGEHQYDWRGIQPRQLYLAKQIESLKNNLRNSKAMWKIVVGHHPLRSICHHGNTMELMEHIYPIIKDNDVHLYINGHDHCLEHIEDDESDIHFLTSGAGSKAWRGLNDNPDLSRLKFFYDGQGFMSLSLDSSRINISFYNVFGNVIHQVKVSKTYPKMIIK